MCSALTTHRHWRARSAVVSGLKESVEQMTCKRGPSKSSSSKSQEDEEEEEEERLRAASSKRVERVYKPPAVG